MSKAKTYEEREFYLKLARKEHYSARELERQIDSGYYERLALSSGKAPSALEKNETRKKMANENGEWIMRGLDWNSPCRIRSWQEKESLRN